MIRKTHIIAGLLLMLPILALSIKPKLSDSNLQMILVLTDDWDSVQGNLFLYERKNTQEPWELQYRTVPVVVGINGMGWEKESYREILSGPLKKEGDKRAPAGWATAGSIFGFAKGLKSSKYDSYLQLTDTIECVDDKKSKYYNKIVDASSIPAKDWQSSEKMRKIFLYEFGLVSGFNSELDANNSCVFMHVWRSKDKGTAGCTAMEKDNLENILTILDSTKKPVIVQLPRQAYNNVKELWGLPNIG